MYTGIRRCKTRNIDRIITNAILGGSTLQEPCWSETAVCLKRANLIVERKTSRIIYICVVQAIYMSSVDDLHDELSTILPGGRAQLAASSSTRPLAWTRTAHILHRKSYKHINKLDDYTFYERG